ncbi:MAG: hypothetical protein KY410_10960, partial [Proteobacteria bacterium]|nr:hypothetical protein [Pseudomonadota bacterium]
MTHHAAYAIALVIGLVTLLAVTGVAPASASESRPRIGQEAWLEWQIADAVSRARQSPRSVDPGAPEPAVQPLTGWTDLRTFARDWADGMA